MDNKQLILTYLENNRGQYVSGEMISKDINVSRTAIWKAINELRKKGYDIRATNNKGYILLNDNDLISTAGIIKHMDCPIKPENIFVFDLLDTTTLKARETAMIYYDWHVIIADGQTRGRGRKGRSFFSPKNKGIYLSAVLKPNLSLSDSTYLTLAAAVAVCKTINTSFLIKPGIKWVNDIFIENKKVCGILTEAVTNFETGELEYVIVSCGINYSTKKEEFPHEIIDTSTSINEHTESLISRNEFIGHLVQNLYEITSLIDKKSIISQYRDYCITIGKKVIFKSGSNVIEGNVVDLDENGSLVIESNNLRYIKRYGEIELLS